MQAMVPGNADSAEQSNNGAGSAAQPPASDGVRKFSPLSHLTAQSARFGLWEVMIFNPKPIKRPYMYGKEKRTSYNFQCMLVSTADPSQYILGDSHGKGMSAEKLNYLENTFKPGLVFAMSKVDTLSWLPAFTSDKQTLLHAVESVVHDCAVRGWRLVGRTLE